MARLLSPRLSWGLVALAVVVLLGFAAYGARVLSSGAPPALLVTGTIEATQVDVSAKITGRIAALLAREGETVAAGQPLVRLDDAELRSEVRRNEAALKNVEARLRDLLAGARREEIEEARATVERAKAQLDDLLAGSRREEVEQARQSVRSAGATRQWAETDYQRIQELYRKELVAAQDVDRARQAYEVAVAQERSARESLELALAGPRPHQVEAARAQLRAASERLTLLLAGPRPHQVEGARAQVAQFQAELAHAESRLREAVIASPLSGVVLRKNLEAGEIASPGVPILTLVDPKNLWLRAYVPETEVGKIRLGQPARVKIDAFRDRTFAGKISEIASEAEFTPKNVQTHKERVNLVFRIKISVDGAGGVLKPGMPADAEIVL